MDVAELVLQAAQHPTRMRVCASCDGRAFEVIAMRVARDDDGEPVLMLLDRMEPKAED